MDMKIAIVLCLGVLLFGCTTTEERCLKWEEEGNRLVPNLDPVVYLDEIRPSSGYPELIRDYSAEMYLDGTDVPIATNHSNEYGILFFAEVHPSEEIIDVVVKADGYETLIIEDVEVPRCGGSFKPMGVILMDREE